MNAQFPSVTRGWMMLLCAAAIAGCAALQQFTLPGDRYADSFVGIRFGSTLSQAQMLYPLGNPETSPYGADAYELRDVDQGAAKYNSVVFEFTSDHGMQLVVARFTPGSRDVILQELKRKFGTPQESAVSDLPDQPEANWKTANRVRIEFYGVDRRLVLIGPYGEPLEPDIALRKQLETY